MNTVGLIAALTAFLLWAIILFALPVQLAAFTVLLFAGYGVGTAAAEVCGALFRRRRPSK